MKRLEERVAELEHVIALLSEKINLTVRDEDLGYMTSKEVVDYIGCPVSLMRNWRKKVSFLIIVGGAESFIIRRILITVPL